MYLKAWCTCRAVVLHIKPILLSLSSLSPSWLPKLRIVEVKTCYAALFTGLEVIFLVHLQSFASMIFFH